MTVICYRAGVMASDGRITEDNTIFTNKAQKIFRLKNGGLLGSSGDADDMDLLNLVNRSAGKNLTHKKLIALEFEFAAIMVDPDGTIHVFESIRDETTGKFKAAMFQVNEQFTAVGSGSSWAIGAMDRGATAEQAVKTAIRYDNNCGGPVQTLKLKEV